MPSVEQIVEALRAVGAPVPPGLAQALPVRPPAPSAPSAPPAPPAVSLPPASGLELDTGRHASVGSVVPTSVQDMVAPGFYRPMAQGQAPLIEVIDLEPGRHAPVPNVPVVAIEGVERARFESVGPVETPWLEELASSGFYDPSASAPAPVAPLEGLETTAIDSGTPSTGARRGRRSSSLSYITCRCSEVHRLARCPSCGSPHPEDDGGKR